MNHNNSDKTNRLKKLIDLFRSFGGRAPDYESLDQADPFQTEEKYQEEQKKWLEEVRKKKMNDSLQG